jgi:hypothetical protein
MTKFPFRDSLTPKGHKFWGFISLYSLIDQINRSNIPVYLINGWYDPLARENFIIYANLTVPKRLFARRPPHISFPGAVTSALQLRVPMLITSIPPSLAQRQRYTF